MHTRCIYRSSTTAQRHKEGRQHATARGLGEQLPFLPSPLLSAALLIPHCCLVGSAVPDPPRMLMTASAVWQESHAIQTRCHTAILTRCHTATLGHMTGCICNGCAACAPSPSHCIDASIQCRGDHIRIAGGLCVGTTCCWDKQYRKGWVDVLGGLQLPAKRAADRLDVVRKTIPRISCELPG